MNRKLTVKIAKDVIKQLRLKRFKVKNSVYVQLHNLDIDDLGHASFKEVFRENKELKCNVCALGATFLSYVNLENQYTVDEISYGLSCGVDFNKLKEVLGVRNILIMEYVFEKGKSGLLANILKYGDTYLDTDQYKVYKLFSPQELKAAIAYGIKYKKPEDRLRAIMLNVIRNNGSFEIPKKMMGRSTTQKGTTLASSR